MSPKEVKILQCWLGVSDDISRKEIVELYKKGELQYLTSLSKDYIVEEYGNCVTLYRWETDSCTRALQSWSLYEDVARSYKELKPDGYLVKKEFSADDIVLSTEALVEADYELDAILGMYPMDEVIVVRRDMLSV